jgi:hypothetical protein
MAALPTEILVWPQGVDLGLWGLTGALGATLAVLVGLRETGRSVRPSTRLRLEGVHPADDQLRTAA